MLYVCAWCWKKHHARRLGFGSVGRGTPGEAKIKSLNLFKYNEEVFNSLQKNKISIDIDEKILQFRFGESQSEHEIIIVISINCEFCKNKLETLNDFVHSWHPKIKIFIVFCINHDSKSESIACTEFSNLYSKDKKTSIFKFISYLNNLHLHKDIVSRYDIEGANNNQLIISQTNWCKENGIYKVPTIIVDRKIIPEQYDLKDFLYMY